MSEGGRGHRPPQSTPTAPTADEGPAYVPPGSSDSAHAAIARIARAIPYRPLIQRKAEAVAGEAPKDDKDGAEVSQPGDSAELEADAVADQVAGELHGGPPEKGEKKKNGGKKAKGDKKEGAGGEGDAKGREEVGDEADDKAEVGDEKEKVQEKGPLKINAKLEGVGRKIFLADDKNKADASIKRLGKSGQDKQALKDALKKVQHERSICVDELTQLKGELPKLGLSRQRAQEVQGGLDTALNSINDHLTDADITGAMRDTAADPVRKSGSGEEYDHLREVNEGLAGLQGARDDLIRLRRDLNRRQIDPKLVAEKLNPTLTALQRTIQAVGQAVKKVKP